MHYCSCSVDYWVVAVRRVNHGGEVWGEIAAVKSAGVGVSFRPHN